MIKLLFIMLAMLAFCTWRLIVEAKRDAEAENDPDIGHIIRGFPAAWEKAQKEKEKKLKDDTSK